METIRFKSRTFLILSSYAREGEPCPGPEEAARVAHAIFRELDADVEHFAVLALNARGRVRGHKVVATGTLTASLVHPREIFRAAIVLAAAQIIVVHNHPSGDCSPSTEDLRLTDRLREAGKILGIPVVDHLILGEGETYASIGA